MARAKLKRDIAAGEVTAGEVLRRRKIPVDLDKMRIGEVLGAMPRFGPIKVRRACLSVGIDSTLYLREISPRTRQRLCAEIVERYPAVAAQAA
jgi:hypothetical protein